MNSTLKCWLIANFEIIIFLIAAVITGLVAIAYRTEIFPLVKDHVGKIMFLFLFSYALVHPTRKLGVGIIRYLVLILVHVLYTVFNSNTHEPVIAVWVTWVILGVSSFLGGWTAFYANQNIDEVISLRMLYRNSSVDLFEITWKYTIDRFCSISFSLSVFIYWMIFMKIYINKLL